MISITLARQSLLVEDADCAKEDRFNDKWDNDVDDFCLGVAEAWGAPMSFLPIFLSDDGLIRKGGDAPNKQNGLDLICCPIHHTIYSSLY